MSDDILTNSDLKTLVQQWQRDWGEERSDKAGVPYWAIPRANMVDAMKELIIQLQKNYGYEKKDFSRVLPVVLDVTAPIEAAKTRAKGEKWQNIHERLWMVAMISVFDDYKRETDIPETKSNPIQEKPKRERIEKDGVTINEDGSIVHHRPSAESVNGFKSRPESEIERDFDLLADIEEEE